MSRLGSITPTVLNLTPTTSWCPKVEGVKVVDDEIVDVDSPTYNNIYLEKSDNSELLLAKNVPAGSRVMSP